MALISYTEEEVPVTRPAGRWEGADPYSLQVPRRCSPLDEDIPDAASEVAEGTWLRGTPELEEWPPILPSLPPAGPRAGRSVLQLIVHIQPDPAGRSSGS